jgi:hypothetical protein
MHGRDLPCPLSRQLAQASKPLAESNNAPPNGNRYITANRRAPRQGRRLSRHFASIQRLQQSLGCASGVGLNFSAPEEPSRQFFRGIFLPRSPPFRRELHHVLRHSILRQRPELRLHTFARRWHEIAWRAAGDPRISARKVAQAVGAFVEEINNRSAAPGPSSASPA